MGTIISKSQRMTWNEGSSLHNEKREGEDWFTKSLAVAYKYCCPTTLRFRFSIFLHVFTNYKPPASICFPLSLSSTRERKKKGKMGFLFFFLETNKKTHCEEPLAIFTFRERKKPGGTPNPSVIFEPFSFLIPLDGHLQTALSYKFLNSTICLQ